MIETIIYLSNDFILIYNFKKKYFFSKVKFIKRIKIQLVFNSDLY